MPALASTGGATVALNAVTTTATSATFNVSTSDATRVHVWSASGSTATIQVECRGTSSAPWYPCIQGGIVNPDPTGEYWSMPLTIQLRVRVSNYTSGAISATVETHILK
jgi:hypothetical protein